MNSDDLFAYILQEDLVRSVLPAWPQDMALGVCLRADGSCKMVVGHAGQEARLLIRIAVMHDLPAGSFPVAPEAFGWPTRRVRFSEEQDILRLVADADNLVETARQFAQADQPIEQRSVAAPKERPAPIPAPTPVRATDPIRRRITLAAPVAKPEPPLTRGMPQGFAPAGATGRRECHFASGFVGRHGNSVRVTLNPEMVTIHTQPHKVHEIGFSADFRQYHVPREAVHGWRAGKAAIIDIPPAAFPAGLCERLVNRRFQIDATITAEGVFLTQGPEIVSAPIAGDITPPPPRRPFSFRSAAALAVILLGTAAATFMLLNGEKPFELAMTEVETALMR